jgi:hypothetical protein
MQLYSRRAAATATIAVCTLGAAGAGGFAAFRSLRARPTQLAAAGGPTNDTIVVNTTQPTRLNVSVLDQYGRLLPADTTVQFRLVSGAVALSSAGETTCARREDALVRAAYGGLIREFILHCRPVLSLESPSWIDLAVGDRPRDLSFVARGPDGTPVTELRGTVTVGNPSVAQIVGTTIRARQPGTTVAVVDVGNRETKIAVQVYRLVTSFVDNPAHERLLGMRVRLARGDTIVVPVPKAAFWVKYFPAEPGSIPPTIEVRGNGTCTTGDGLHVKRVEEDEYAKYCLVYDGASLMIAHGATGADVVNGTVALELEWR